MNFLGHENLSSTDEDADDDLSGSEAEFSAGEMEEARVTVLEQTIRIPCPFRYIFNSFQPIQISLLGSVLTKTFRTYYLQISMS